MSTVNFDIWSKLAQDKDPVNVYVEACDEPIVLEVKPRISMTERCELGASVIAACKAYATTLSATVPYQLYYDCIFRWFVLLYYTNLDMTDERVNLDSVWGFVGQEQVWEQITEAIEDNIFDLDYNVCKALDADEAPWDELGRRLLSVLDKVKAMLPSDLMDQLEEIIQTMQEEGIGLDNLVSLDEARDQQE